MVEGFFVQLCFVREKMATGIIVVVKANRSRAAEKHVNERIVVGDGNCVSCDESVCTCGKKRPCGCDVFQPDVRKQRRRGLCPRCEQRWETARGRFPTEEEKAAFDAELIRQGLLLASGEITELVQASNPFSAVAKELSP